MGLFYRIKTLLKSNINDMISKAENPEKMLNQLISDMTQQFNRAKIEVAKAIADEKKLNRQLEEQKSKVKLWSKRAEMAVQKEDDTLALEALSRKKEHEQLTQQYEKHWNAQSQATDALKTHLCELSNKIEEARRKKDLLIARQKRADAQKSIQKTLGGLNNTSAFDTFSRMEEKVDKIEGEADAELELDNDLSSDNPDKKFEKLETSNSELSDELTQLKAKMGKE